MKKYVLPLLGMALYFAACEDDLTAAPGNDGAEVVASFKKLEKCEKAILGKLVYVSDSVKVYACTDDGWTAVTGTDGSNGKNGTNGKNGKDGADGKDGTDGKSCTMTAFKDGTGFDVICDGKSIGTVKNGTDGAKGKDGTNGKDGTSCSVAKAEKSNDVIVTCGKESVTIHNGVDGQPGTPGTNGANGKDGTSCSVAKAENSDDVVVTCGEKSVTIHNGVDGQLGAPGASGASCKIASDKDGVVQLQCGEGENATTTKLYKAMCGTQPYDPETSLCKEGQVYFKCGNDTYDPKKEFCYENQKYDFCENDEYNPSEKFCVNNKLYDLCNGKKYDVSKQFCANNGKPENLCDGEEYDVSIYFCYSDVPVERCGGNEYDLTKEFCSGGEKYNLCGGQKYDVSEKFCYDGKTYGLCGGVDYNPITHECENGTSVSFEAACGDVKYNKKNSFCAEFENKKTHEKTYQVYKFVKIAPEGINYAKTWMAENLKYVTKDSYCYGGQQSCDSYGRLYTWEAAKEACPVGWHLPTQREWETLLAAVKGENGAGYALKSKTDWDGDDTYHFTALPGGVGENGQYSLIGILANFWTATEAESGEKAIYVSLESKVDTWGEGASSVNNLFSVRCLKGNPRN